jgi:pyruvate,water dikinase
LGFGENIVKGTITPDEMVFKPTLENPKLNPILKRNSGKEFYDDLCRKEKKPLNIPS